MEIGGLKCMAQKAEAYGMNDQECRWSHCGEGGGAHKVEYRKVNGPWVSCISWRLQRDYLVSSERALQTNQHNGFQLCIMLLYFATFTAQITFAGYGGNGDEQWNQYKTLFIYAVVW